MLEINAKLSDLLPVVPYFKRDEQGQVINNEMGEPIVAGHMRQVVFTSMGVRPDVLVFCDDEGLYTLLRLLVSCRCEGKMPMKEMLEAASCYARRQHIRRVITDYGLFEVSDDDLVSVPSQAPARECVPGQVPEQVPGQVPGQTCAGVPLLTISDEMDKRKNKKERENMGGENAPAHTREAEAGESLRLEEVREGLGSLQEARRRFVCFVRHPLTDQRVVPQHGAPEHLSRPDRARCSSTFRSECSKRRPFALARFSSARNGIAALWQAFRGLERGGRRAGRRFRALEWVGPKRGRAFRALEWGRPKRGRPFRALERNRGNGGSGDEDRAALLGHLAFG